MLKSQEDDLSKSKKLHRDFTIFDTFVSGQTSLCIAFSMDGKYFAIGHASGDIQIWDATSCKKLYRFKVSSSTVSSLSFSINSKYLVSGSYDGNTYVWDTITFEKLMTLNEDYSNDSWVRDDVEDVFFSLNGKYLAVRIDGVDQQTYLRIRDAITFQEICVLHQKYNDEFAFSPNSKVLLTSGFSVNGEDLIHEYDLFTLQKVNDSRSNYLRNFYYRFRLQFAFSGDGRYFATTNNSLVIVHNASTYETVFSFKRKETSCMAFSHNNKYFAIIVDLETLMIFDTKTFGLQANIYFPKQCNPCCISFSMDDKYIIVIARDSYKVDLHFL